MILSPSTSAKVKERNREILLRHGAGVDDLPTVAKRLGMDQWVVAERAGECGVQVVKSRPNKWDVMTIATMITMRQYGVEWSVIAAAIGKTEAACNGQRQRLSRVLFNTRPDVITKDQILELKATGESLSAAARNAGITASRLIDACHRHGIDTCWAFKKWTTVEVKKAIQLREEGLLPVEIAERLGRSISSVCHQFKEAKKCREK